MNGGHGDRSADEPPRPPGDSGLGAPAPKDGGHRSSDEATLPNNFAELIGKLLGGELQPEEEKALSHALAHDESLRAAYEEQAIVHATLLWSHGRAQQQRVDGIDPLAVAEMLAEAENATRKRLEEEAAEELRRSLQAQAELASQKRPRPSTGRIGSHAGVAYATAAVLAAMLLLSVFGVLSPKTSQDLEAQKLATSTDVAIEPPAAMITGSVDALISRTPAEGAVDQPVELSTAAGSHLRVGDYRLEAGVVELDLRSAVRLLIEGQSSFSLLSGDRIRIDSGRLVGVVSPKSVGFTVETPSASVVDLGTEFGVEVGEDLDVGIAVFDGAIEVVAVETDQASGDSFVANRQRLTTDQQARVTPDKGLVAARVNSDHFFRELPTAAALASKQDYDRWLAFSKSLSDDPDVLVHYTFENQRREDRILFNRAGDTSHGVINGPVWTKGRWPQKQALQFANLGELDRYPHVLMDVPGSSDEVTLAMWVNLDAIRDAQNGLFLSEAYSQRGMLHWQLRSDRRLHVGHIHDRGDHQFDSDGVLPIETNRWHLLAAVIDQKNSTIRFFVDGKFDGKAFGPLASGLPLARMRLGSWEPDETRVQGGSRYSSLHGRIDEFLVIRRALTVEEIKQIFEAGQP